MSNHLYLHIMTAPSQREGILASLRATVVPPGNLSKPESIQKWLEENGDAKAQELLLKTAYDGTLGEVLAIAWAVNSDMVQVLSRPLDRPESDLLNEFFATLIGQGTTALDFQVVGHNILGFHLRFLFQRCVINRVQPPFDLPLVRYNNALAFDTLQAWAGWNKMVSLVDLAAALGIEANPDLSAADLMGVVKGGDVGCLEDLCSQVVDDVRAVHRRMVFLPDLLEVGHASE